MKSKVFLLLLLLILVSCNDENLAPTKPIDDVVDEHAVPLLSGAFMNGPYGTVIGNARIYQNSDGSFDLALEGFNTTNGPDLYVYLSKEIMPVNYISLSKLRSTNGNQVYAVTGTSAFSEYKYVCIHCKQYNHLFGYALLV